MAPVLKERLTLRSGRGSHWLTFDLKGDYGYVAPEKSSADGTEIFDAHTHASVGVIRSSEDLLEIDFADGGKIIFDDHDHTSTADFIHLRGLRPDALLPQFAVEYPR